MNGALTIGRVYGIPIRVHYSFLFILPLVVVTFARTFGDYADAAIWAGIPVSQLRGSRWLWGTLLALSLFASVVLHELSHAWMAIRKGGKVNDITLIMIGGVTHVAEPPREPHHESIMALVGPLTSFALAGLCYVAYWLLQVTTAYSLSFALFYLAGINFTLGAFNLIPAFPMDGGRILRGLLVQRMGVVRATEVAARLGKVFAVLFVLISLFTLNFVLMLIAFFIYMGAEAEAAQVVAKSVLGDVRVRDLMDAPSPIESKATLEAASNHMRVTRQLALPVMSAGRLDGVISLDDIKQVPPGQRAHTLVTMVMRPADHCALNDNLWDVLRKMSAQHLALLPVLDRDQLVGTVAHDDIARALRLHELQSESTPPRWPRLSPR